MSPLRAHIFHENEFSWWRDTDDAVNFDVPLGQISLSLFTGYKYLHVSYFMLR